MVLLLLRNPEINTTRCTTRRFEGNRGETTRTILRVWRWRRRGAQPVHSFNNQEDHESDDEKTHNIIDEVSVRDDGQASQLRIRERRRPLTGNIDEEV